MSSPVFSSAVERQELARVLQIWNRLPLLEQGKMPGDVLEVVLAHVRRAQVLHTYDFMDVVSPKEKVRWQVKSTQKQTPLTWKRAKIAGSQELIASSRRSSAGLQHLGNAIIEHCNAHAHESLEKYDLQEIGYTRLVVDTAQNQAFYFERLLCTREKPAVFNARDFTWE